MGLSLASLAARMGEAAEKAGWDGMLVVDSQNLAGDAYVGLTLAAQATSRLLLGTGVTNPYTRHPAVTASAIASVQVVSQGRAVLGIGRGDSSLAHLGLAPAPVDAFGRYLERVQAYLRGESVAFTPPDGPDAPPPVDALGLAGAPQASSLQWLDPALAKVPLDVAATGASASSRAACIADRVTFAVGADPERLQWALDVARTARTEAGLDPAGVSYGAYVNVVAHPDVAVARRLASGGLASFARFSVMHGTVSGPATDDARAVFHGIHDAYDMNRHTRADGAQASQLTPEFVDRFGVVGPAPYCVDRLLELAGLGLDRFVVIGPTAGAGDRDEFRAARDRIADEVVPALRS